MFKKIFNSPAIADESLINILPSSLECLILPIRYKKLIDETLCINDLFPLLKNLTYTT